MTLLTLWGEGAVRITFCSLTGSRRSDHPWVDDFERNIVCVGVIADLKRMITCVRRGHDDGVVRTVGGGEEHLDVGKTPGVRAGERGDEVNGLVLCRQQTRLVDENAWQGGAGES